MNAFVYKLDKTQFPVFRVKYFVFSEEKCIEDECKFIIVANIEGSISVFYEGNGFLSLVNINNNETNPLFCNISRPSKIQDNYKISCNLYYEMEHNFESYDFDLTPYYMIYNYYSPFEIIIENNIKAINYEDYQKKKENKKEF